MGVLQLSYNAGFAIMTEGRCRGDIPPGKMKQFVWVCAFCRREGALTAFRWPEMFAASRLAARGLASWAGACLWLLLLTGSATQLSGAAPAGTIPSQVLCSVLPGGRSLKECLSVPFISPRQNRTWEQEADKKYLIFVCVWIAPSLSPKPLSLLIF